MVITVFRSRLRPEGQQEYAECATRMSELAVAMPGYISHKAFTAPDGERVIIVEFESDEAQRAWAEHPEHRDAQRRGRERFYAEFRLQVCRLLHESAFPVKTSVTSSPTGGRHHGAH